MITKIIVSIFLIATLGNAQFSWDMDYKNLQVFADSISSEELSGEMKAFSIALGVRCNYCHDDSKGKELDQIDFASDIKDQKKIARKMIQMSRTINRQFIDQVKTLDHTAVSVSCMTCHRGYREPKHLSTILKEEYNLNGLEGALNTYHRLRKKYYGGFTFDFGESTLNNFGYMVMRLNPQDAIVIFKLNTELFPDSYNVYDSLAEAYYTAGDKETALQNYSKSLELNPKNINAKKMLQQLK